MALIGVELEVKRQVEAFGRKDSARRKKEERGEWQKCKRGKRPCLNNFSSSCNYITQKEGNGKK